MICSLVTSVYLGTMKQGCFKPLHDCFGFSSLNNTFKKSHDCLRKLLTLIKSQLLITFFSQGRLIKINSGYLKSISLKQPQDMQFYGHKNPLLATALN